MVSIPNTSPWITDREIDAVQTILREGRLSSNEENLRPAKDALKRLTAGHPVLLTTSCTTALELALHALQLQPGDEVLVPSFTFVTTASAVIQAGGTPVFVDIEDRTLNIDIDQLASAVTPRTRAIMPVHYSSISCDMDRLLAFAKEHRLAVVEDAAHAVGALYRGRPLGSLGDFGCFSFHDTKNYVCGEGGAIVINNPAYKEIIECMYEKGTNRSQFLRGEVDKYTWISRGSSYVLSSVLASMLHVQLERFEEIRSGREAVVRRYEQGLQSLVDEGLIRFQDVPSYATPNYHISCILVEDASRRDPLLRFLKDRGVGALFHYIPLDSSPFVREHLLATDRQCPVTERVAASIVRLPLYPHLTPQACDYVIDAIREFFHPSGRPVAQVTELATSTVRASEQIDFSLVVACYNEAPHLQTNLDVLIDILDELQMAYEIIIIDDHSPDATPDRIREYLIKHPHHRLRAVFHETNKGRGATVTEGIRMARGRFVGFLDIDLEVHARYIPAALIALERGHADMVLADRHYRFHFFVWQRYMMSKGYRFLVQRLLRTPSLDTESGFKFFRREAILPILDRIRDPHWFWDTEVTVRSLDAGLRIHMEPVLFDRNQRKMSTVRAFRDSWRMITNLFALRRERQRDPALPS